MWRISKSRLQYWPRLYERHIHQARPLGPLLGHKQVSCSSKPQRFCQAADALELGDPMENIFVINLRLGCTHLHAEKSCDE